MNTIVLIIACISRMIYLQIPAILLLISIQAIVYKTTGISPFNKVLKLFERMGELM